jgi:2-dehydropantoate 2-reductase
MQISVIGAGAIGGILAEATHLAGHDVTLCVRTPIPSLQIERDGKVTPVPVAIATEPPGEGAARAD